MTDNYAVVGNPIGHSKSPAIHQAFAAQTSQALKYNAICVEPGDFVTHTELFFQQGHGLNITIPFKQEAWQLAVNRSDRAELAGAVNTLFLNESGELCGDNTDGVGMVRDIISNHGGVIENKRVLVLGAGGAVRGVLQPILKELPSKLVIANRTLTRAEELVELFQPYTDVEVSSASFADLTGQEFDLVINGTAASLQGDVPPLPDNLLAENAWCYDMMYSAEPTAFCVWAQAHGAKASLDGLGMLVEQAAESFYIWRKVRPDTAKVIAQLREQLQPNK